QHFQEGQAAFLAMHLAQGFAAAKTQERGAASLVRSHPGLFVFRGEQVNVCAEFLVEVVVLPRLGKDPEQPGEEGTDGVAHREGSFWVAKNRAITAERCSQFSAVSARRRQPRRVME